MTLAERLRELVRAAFSGIYVHSFEHQDAIAEIAGLCRQEGWSLATWDVDRGLALAGPATDATAAVQAADPLAAIRSLGALATPEGTAILVLRNFHRFLNSVEVVQALDTQIHAGQAGPHLRRHPRPGRADPRRAGEAVRPGRPRPARPRPARSHRPLAGDRAGRAARGGRPGRRPRRGGGPDPHGGRERPEPRPGPPRPARPRRPLGDQGRDAQEVRPADLHRGGETFADLGGLEALKSFCSRALRPGRPPRRPGPRRPAAGPPGLGQERLRQGAGPRDGPARRWSWTSGR